MARVQNALLLAASDMDQAAAAARALQDATDWALARALETAMAVCYMRAFTKSSLGTLPDEFLPGEPGDAERHASLMRLRDKFYAHTDVASGRQAQVTIEGVEGTTMNLMAREQWLPLPRQILPEAIDYFERQAMSFRRAAGYLELELRSYGHGSGTADGADPA